MNLITKYYWLLLPISTWLILRFGFEFNGLYGQDAYAYLLHAREWKQFFLGGELPGVFFWPPNYPLISGLLALVLGSEFYSLQLVSLLSFVAVGWLFDQWIKTCFTQVDDLSRMTYVILGWFLSPYMIRLGMQSMSEMLTMFFLTVSFLQLWKYLQTESNKNLLLWAITSAMALTTRYPVIVVLLPAMVFVAYSMVIKKQYALLAACVLVGSVPVSLSIWWKLHTVGDNQVIQNSLFYDWKSSNFFLSGFQRTDTNSQFALPNLLYNLCVAIHPGTFIYGVILLPFAVKTFKKNVFNILLLISILVYAVFLSGMPFQNARVMTFTFPLVVMFLAPAFFRFLFWLRVKVLPVHAILLLCLLWQVPLCARAIYPSVTLSNFERELAQWISQNHPKSSVYTSAYSLLFDTYQTGNPVIETFSSEIQHFENGAVFIFNRSWAEFKLKGTMQLQNWDAANNQMHVAEQKCWTNGWCVYTLSSE